MNSHPVRVVAALTLAVALSLNQAAAQDAPKPAAPKAPGKAAKTAVPRKADPAFAVVTDDPKLPRVLLIGDSISIGYTVATRELLKGRANVHRIGETGGPTTNGLGKLDKWLGAGKWDVIHFNWGLHDLKFMPDGKHQVTLEQYEKNLGALVKRLQATGATLVWCSTTPVPDAPLEPPRKNDDVKAFNAAAARVMAAGGVRTDDLYAHALPRLAEIQRPANVHFTEAGSRVLAEQVAKSIEAALADRAKR
jgi:lysophospholipase L1-like esterase